ncbi:hypothetical protein KKA13_02445 [Patescibacteria group bacterium]|nr:hypothetical protein [Patescibacteria group bacterium]
MKTQNPSIGTIGMAYADQVNNRTKGFFIGVHGSLAEVRSTLARALEVPRFGSRETYRILADGRLSEAELKDLQMVIEDRRLHCEAVVPVRHHDIVAHIAYYAHNNPERSNSVTTTSQ